MADQENIGLSLDDISDFGEIMPGGIEFDAQPKKVEIQQSDKDGKQKWYVKVNWAILSDSQNGRYEGVEVSTVYFPQWTKSAKNGKYYSRGASSISKLCSLAGKPIDRSKKIFFFAPSKAQVAAIAKEMHNSLKGVKMRFKTIQTVQQVKDQKTGKYVDKIENGEKVVRTEYEPIGVSRGELPKPAVKAPEPQELDDIATGVTGIISDDVGTTRDAEDSFDALSSL